MMSSLDMVQYHGATLHARANDEDKHVERKPNKIIVMEAVDYEHRKKHTLKLHEVVFLP